MRPSFLLLVAGPRLPRWSVVVLCSGCARFGYDIPERSDVGRGGAGMVLDSGAAGAAGATASPTGGAGGTDASGGDAGPLLPCGGGGAFGTPVVLGGLPSPPLFGPALSADGLSLYFASSGDLFTARRARIDDTTFTDIRPIANVNSNVSELTPRLSSDGRTLYFARDPDGSALYRDLMQSERPSAADPFGAPTAITVLNDPFWSELSPEPSFDGDELLFTSSRPGGPGRFDIWRGRRSGGSFSSPELVVSLSSPEDDSGVALSRDGHSAVFSSARIGTIGERDLWLATRPTLADDFTLTANLAELNTAANDADPAWRSDNAELLFVSDRSGASLLYSSVRPCTP